MSIEKENSQGESEANSTVVEGGLTCFMGQNSGGGWQIKGKSKGIGKSDGTCCNCGKTGHRSRDCWSERSKGKSKGKGEQKRTGGHTQSERGNKGKPP